VLDFVEGQIMMQNGSDSSPVPLAESLCAAFQHTVARQPDALAFVALEDAQRYTWRDYADEVERVASALHRLGVRRGDTVGIMLRNRPEFHFVDTGALHLGAIPVSIYNTLPAEDVAWVLNDAAASVVVSEQMFASVLEEAARYGWKKKALVFVDSTPRLTDVVSSPDEFDFDSSWRRVRQLDLATISYTSGTTGPPKGVELTQRSVLGVLAAVAQVVGTVSDARVVSYLPTAHVAERLISHYPSIVHGVEVWCCPDTAAVAGHFAQVRPTHLFSPPRLFEKIRAALESCVINEHDAALQTATMSALEDGYRLVDLREARQPIPAELHARYEAGRVDYLTPLLARVGLDRVRVALAGSAPVNPEMVRYFLALGLPLRECWGISEACGFAAISDPTMGQLGCVGAPMPGTAVRQLDDGELLIRSPWLMNGYHNRPELTAETIDDDGWLHTGDVGSLDAEGNVRITDRKKELIINSFGKNMSPANIEAKLKDAHPVIGQACVIGDARPYNVALLVLDPVVAATLRARQGDEVQRTVDAAVEQANARMSRVETIKKYVVLDDEWLPGGVELSPTMKLRRRQIAVKYADTIESLYDEAGTLRS